MLMLLSVEMLERYSGRDSMSLPLRLREARLESSAIEAEMEVSMLEETSKSWRRLMERVKRFSKSSPLM